MKRLALLTALCAFLLPAMAADPVPEIKRDAAKPQVAGAAHTLRVIPEACARIEGVFTGQVADPYKFSVVRTSERCQARAQFLDAAKAKPSAKGGWIFNDIIRVPSAACPTQVAVARIWRKPGAGGVPPKLDQQGRSRIYLEDARQKAAANQLASLPVYAAQLSLEGKGCN